MKDDDSALLDKRMFPLIISIAFPIMLSMAFQSLYNIVDSIFISRYSTNAFASVSLVQPILFLLVTVGSGIGTGISSLLSRTLGAQDREKAKMVVTNSLFFSLIMAILLPFILFFISDDIIVLITKDFGIIKDANDYIRICILAYPFQLIAMEVGFILLSQGQARANMLIQSVGILVNMVLDPIFIFTFDLGAIGAALATMSGHFISFCFCLYLFKTGSRYHIDKSKLKMFPSYIGEVYKVALPSFLTQSSASFVAYVLNGIVLSFSVVHLGVYGMYLKMESFMFLACQGIASALVTIAGYNYGANNKERVIKALRLSLLSGWSIMFIGFFIFQYFTPYIVKIFTDDPDVMKLGIRIFKATSYCFLLTPIQIMLSSFFHALGKGGRAMAILFVRFYFVLIPISLIISNYFPEPLFWYSFLFSDIITFPVALSMYLYTKRTLLEN